VVLSISAAVYCAKSNQYSMSAWQRDQICMAGKKLRDVPLAFHYFTIPLFLH